MRWLIDGGSCVRTGDCLQFPTPRGAVLDLHISGMVRRLKQDDGFVGIDGLCHGMICAR